MITSLPLKTHGGKSFLADRIVGLMEGVEHTCFAEPYAGGLAVLFAKNPVGVSEVVNDLNGDLICFYRVLQDENLFAEFQRLVEVTPFSEELWREAKERQPQTADAVQRAYFFFVCCRMSLAGRMRSFTGITKTRTRHNMNGEVSAWLSCVDGLPEIHKRFRRVLILNRPALEVIKGQDGPKTLYYIDPPYVHETRRTTKEYGAFEMTEQDHDELLDALANIKGKFILSGYHCKLYDEAADDLGWHHVDVDIANHASSGKSKRRMTEVCWTNFLPNKTLFDGVE